MPSQWWLDDERLLAELHEALRPGPPVGEEIVEAGKAAYTWRTIDDELAELAYDSLLEDGRLVGVRGSAGPRTMVFDGSGLSIEIQVGGLRGTGQLVPAQSGRVQVLAPDSAGWEEPVDQLGRFSFASAQAGPVRLRCTAADGTTVVTGWIPLTHE